MDEAWQAAQGPAPERRGGAPLDRRDSGLAPPRGPLLPAAEGGMGLRDLPEAESFAGRNVAFCVGSLQLIDETQAAWEWCRKVLLHEDDNLFVVHVHTSDDPSPQASKFLLKHLAQGRAALALARSGGRAKDWNQTGASLPQSTRTDEELLEMCSWLPLAMLRQIQSSYLANHLVLLEPQKGQDYRQCLVEFFEEESIVLAVTGSRDSPNPFPTAGGMTAAKRLTGSTAMYLANTAPCPMVITRKAIGDNHFFSRPRHVVISLAPAVPGAAALDDHIVSFATANLLLGNDVVTVTSVVADEAQKAACEAALAGPMAKLHAFQASYSEHESKPKCELHVFAGNAAEIVMSCVKSAKPRVDLLVCGTRGHTGVKKLFLGSTSELFVTASPCPVCVVRAPGK